MDGEQGSTTSREVVAAAMDWIKDRLALWIWVVDSCLFLSATSDVMHCWVWAGDFLVVEECAWNRSIGDDVQASIDKGPAKRNAKYKDNNGCGDLIVEFFSNVQWIVILEVVVRVRESKDQVHHGRISKQITTAYVIVVVANGESAVGIG